MREGFFITGTDTEVGKTLVCSLIMNSLKRQYTTVLPYKPVVAGLRIIDGKMQNEDVIVLQRNGSRLLPPDTICPYHLKAAIAPHIAAEREKINLDPDVMLQGYRAVCDMADAIVVEGVGGFIVPIKDGFDTSSFAQQIKLPVVLVVGLRLGCINHALLTSEAILSRGLVIAGWVANCIDSPINDTVNSNIATLKRLIRSPCLGIIPFRENLRTPYQEKDIIDLQYILDLSLAYKGVTLPSQIKR